MKLIPLLLLTFSCAAVNAENIKFTSNGTQPQVIQLFTSQGCSSCPPAERYLNTFIDNDKLWKDVIPMAFHVDYWDYLGWKDPFASKNNTNVQYQYKRNNHISSVYTPGFVIDGKEWKSWFGIRSLPNQKTNTNILKTVLNGQTLDVDFENSQSPMILNVAVLGADITTDIHRGENEGKSLTQHFVVLGHKSQKSSDGKWNLSLPQLKQSNAKRYALAVWVTTTESLNPIQSTGGWLPNYHF